MLPPIVPRLKILSLLPRIMRRPHLAFSRFFREYGDNFLFVVSKVRRTHMTIDADVVEHVLRTNHRNYHKSDIQTDQLARYLGEGLLTNNGPGWLSQRRLIQPGFKRQRMEALVSEMQAVIQDQCRELTAAATTDRTVDLHHFTRNCAFRIIARAIFTDGFNEVETQELNGIIDRIQHYIIFPVRVPFLRAPLRWLGLERRHLALAQTVRNLILARIEARRGGEARDDLLQMLLDARYEDTGEPMTDDQLIDEIIILFAAGHETSANALAWTLWLLDRHPEHKAMVRAEIDRLGLPDFNTARQFTYLTQVIEESMRLYPPAWITDRVALAADQAGNFDLAKGAVVGIFFYGLHRNPKYYDKPEEFQPERMSPEAKKARHPFSYLPFGGGPRLCIGNHFAMLEMQLILAQVLRDFEFTFPAGANRVGEKPYITLAMDRRLQLQVNLRK